MRVSKRAAATRSVIALLALALAVALVYALGGGSPATAYVPDKIQPALGEGVPKPTVATTFNVSNLSNPGKEINYGDKVKYTGTLTTKNLQTTGSMQIFVDVPSGIVTLDPVPGAENLQVTAGPQPASVEGPVEQNGAWVYTVTGVDNGTTFSFSAQGTVTSDNKQPGATPGTMALGTLKGTYRPEGFSSSIELQPTMPPNMKPRADGACYGVITAESKPLEHGAWIADIKFGEVSAQPNLKFLSNEFAYGTADPTISFDKYGQASATANTIVFNVPGKDPQAATAEILKQAQYYPHDDSLPAVSKLPAKYVSTAHFMNSLNWNFDVSTMTGKVWIPAGTTLKIQRAVEVQNCIKNLAGFGGRSQIMYYAELAVPYLPATGTANASFILPGEINSGPSTCDTVYWMKEALPGTPIEIPMPLGKFEDLETNKPLSVDIGASAQVASNSPIRGQGVSSGTLAISPKFPERLYYVGVPTSGVKGLYYYDTVRKLYTLSHSAAPIFNGNPKRMPLSLGFDKDGILWSWAQGNPNLSPPTRPGYDMALWSLDVNDSDATWQKRVVIKAIDAKGKDVTYDRLIYDLAFDGKGNLYAVQGEVRGGKQVGGSIGRNLIKIPAKVLQNAIATNTPINILGNQVANQQLNVLQGGNYPFVSSDGTAKDPSFNGAGLVFGMAFGPDNNLWLGFGANTATIDEKTMTPVLGKVDLSQVQPGSQNMVTVTPIGVRDSAHLNAPSAQGSFPYMFADLGSCAGLTEQKPAFKVQKSIVDPVTGQVQAPGTAAPNKLEMVDQGASLTLGGKLQRVVEGQTTFYVTVTNTGNKAGATTISDTLNLGNPSYYVHGLTVDGKPAVNEKGTPIALDQNSATFQLNSKELQPGESQTFELVVDVVSTDITSSNLGNIGECQMANNGNSNYGIFNRVSMDNDGDGPSNNQACVPVAPKDNGNLYLYKGIYNPQGDPNAGAFYKYGQPNNTTFLGGASAADVSKFELSAVMLGGTPISGTMTKDAASNVWSPVGGKVVAGTYNLAEAPINGDLASSYNFGSTFNCYADGSNQALATNATSVTVTNGKTVRCYVTNKPVVPFHIEKLAATPANDLDNPHYGATVEPDGSGKLVMKYIIKVTNDSTEYTGNSGYISDYFAVPAGLKWYSTNDGNNAVAANATVSFNAGNSGATVSGLQATLTQQQLADGVVIANSVQGMKPGTSAEFTITIPLAFDDSLNDPTGGSTTTKYEANKDRLGTCDAYTNNDSKQGEQKLVGTDKGVPNVGSLRDENPAYAPDNYLRDNVACIPVKKPESVDMVLRKMDASPTASGVGLKGAEFKICSTEPKFTNGVLDPSMSTGQNPSCVPMSAINEVAGKALGNVTEQVWNANYALYGASACNGYLPAGVTSPTYANRYNYGAAFSACIDQYSGLASNANSWATDQSLFWAKGLVPGQPYWIVETQAPLCNQQRANGNTDYCYSLLPEPVKITLDGSGTITSGANPGTCNPFTDATCAAQQANVGSYDIYKNMIVAHDPRQGKLPKTGGTGPLPWAMLGTLAVLLGGGYLATRLRRS